MPPEGDVATNPFDILEAVQMIQDAANTLYSKADRMIRLGGEHTIALPLRRSAHEHYEPIALIHFDAHLDTWDTYFGARALAAAGTVFELMESTN